MAKKRKKRYRSRPPWMGSFIPKIPKLGVLSEDSDEIPLTGLINGRKASDLEERVARALRRMRVRFLYQEEVKVPGSLSGRGKQVDFLIWSPVKGIIPLEVDGIFHEMFLSEAQDVFRDSQINGIFAKLGIGKITRVKHFDLASQSMTDIRIAEVVNG